MLCINRLKNVRKKCIHKVIWRCLSAPKIKKSSCDLALTHFDQFYSSVFENWSSIRLGLLCPHSYCAITNIFTERKSAYDLFGELEVFNMRDVYYLNLAKPENSSFDSYSSSDISKEDHPSNENSLEEDAHFCNEDSLETDKHDSHIEEEEFMPATKLRQQDFDTEEFDNFYTPNENFNVNVIRHGAIHYPDQWEIYMFPRGKFKKFPPPKLDVTDLLNYYLMDAASLLPVFALDVQKEEEVGDLCASPGGKSLAILFGLRFKKLLCNDLSISRVNKLKTVLNSYLPGTEDWSKKIMVSSLDVCDWSCFDVFDKILLDVPCTNDRLSATKDANNIFHNKRFSERMQLPRIQTSMLCSALQALKSGGSLVYSTCSLSPLQNDGVVHMALSKLSTETSSTFVVADLESVFHPFKSMFCFSDTCQYGQLVVPFLPLNYGPMYISKITRTS